MKEVLAVIRAERWPATSSAAAELGLSQAFQLRVMGRGKQRGLQYLRPHKGTEAGTMPFLPKRMVSWLVPDQLVAPLIVAIVRVNRSGNYGDGKVFVCPVEAYSPAEEALAEPVGAGSMAS